MSLSVLIDATPQLCFHEGIPPTGAPPLSYARLIAVPTIYAESPVNGGGENTNSAFSIANADGALTGLFAVPQLGSTVIFKKDDTTLFTGTISRIVLTDTIQITVEG